MQFKIGDIITGKPGSDKIYGLTNQHAIMKVIHYDPIRDYMTILFISQHGKPGMQGGCGGIKPIHFLKVESRFKKYNDRLNGSLTTTKDSGE